MNLDDLGVRGEPADDLGDGLPVGRVEGRRVWSKADEQRVTPTAYSALR